MLKTKIRFFAFLFLSGCAVTFIMVWFGNSLFIAFESDAPSRSVGSTDSGRLENGKRLPTSGQIFAPTHVSVLCWDEIVFMD